MTPFAAGLGQFIDLDMEGFIGREALLKADRSKLLYGIACETDVPFAGLAVLDGNETVARTTTGAWSPYLEKGIGYARFGAPGDWADRKLILVTPDGNKVECEIVDLPFYDPEKRIPRGLAQ